MRDASCRAKILIEKNFPRTGTRHEQTGNEMESYWNCSVMYTKYSFSTIPTIFASWIRINYRISISLGVTPDRSSLAGRLLDTEAGPIFIDGASSIQMVLGRLAWTTLYKPTCYKKNIIVVQIYLHQKLTRETNVQVIIGFVLTIPVTRPLDTFYIDECLNTISCTANGK